MTLKYEDGAAAQWNGNISAQEWNGGSYVYSYDKLNRLTSGIAADGRSEKSIGYDLNGNITKLERYTSATAKEDGLRYAYSGNRLGWFYDSVGVFANTRYQMSDTTKYGYDMNGNMTSRNNKINKQNNLSIAYNVMNLPRSVTLPTGTVIQYVYDASGRKLRKLAGTSATEYISGIQYSGSTLDFIQTEEGRIVPNGASYKYEYNLSDHLGNVRYSFDSYNGSVRQLQKDDYYPFGLRIARVVSTAENKYLYNGKELQEELGTYDFGARQYDPVIGRFNVVDAKAEHPKQIDTSPYAFTGNNPINRIDPDGNCWPCLVEAAVAVYEGFTAAEVATAAIATGGAIIIGNNIRNYSGDRSFAVRDNTSVVNSKPVNLPKGSEGNPHKTSRAARRDAMRKEGIPTSQPLIPDKATKSKEKVYTDRDKEKTVQDAKNDRSYEGKPHWEAETKKDENAPDGLNRSGNNNKPQMQNGKRKNLIINLNSTIMGNGLDFVIRRNKGKDLLEKYKAIFLSSGLEESELKYIDLKMSDEIRVRIKETFSSLEKKVEMLPANITYSESQLLNSVVNHTGQCYLFSDDVSYCGMYLVENKFAIEHCLAIAKDGYSQTCFIVGSEMGYSLTINYYDKDHSDNPNMFDIQLKISASA